MIIQNKCIFIILSFLSFVDSNLSSSKKLNSTILIAGGTHIDDHDLGKFVVSIQTRENIKSEFGWGHICGGTIISPNKILTAAHCLCRDRRHKRKFRPLDLVVVVGANNRFTQSNTTRVMDVVDLKYPSSFGKDKTLYADVAFLILRNDIEFDNPHVGVINLTSYKPDHHKICTIIGWGRLYFDGPLSDRILFADVQILKNNFCKQSYKEIFTPGMICAAYPDDWNRDSCTGDSGGPLICDGEIAGIISWGVSCALKDFPGVYTDVYYYKTWISGGSRMDANNFVVIFLSSIVLNKKLKNFQS